MVFVILLLCVISVYPNDYKIGVYYFPGWTECSTCWWSPPWEKIKPYPEREPYLGWYKEGEVSVAEQHIEWMADYGIDFVVYDWYWSKEDTNHLGHAINAFLKAKNKEKIDFSILWANHSQFPTSLEQFNKIVTYWIKHYFSNSQYLQIEKKPVVYIFSPYHLRNNARKFSQTVKELFSLADSLAVKAGFEGVYFVACSQAVHYWVLDYIPKNSYSAISSYNYHKGLAGKDDDSILKTTSYVELTTGYKKSWNWILGCTPLPYFIPVTAGWDKRPWGSKTAHDNCHSTPEMFEMHLLDAKNLIDKFPEKTNKTVIICCWNEFGEGSYIEPTKKWEFQYLKKVKRVFGK